MKQHHNQLGVDNIIFNNVLYKTIFWIKTFRSWDQPVEKELSEK